MDSDATSASKHWDLPTDYVHVTDDARGAFVQVLQMYLKLRSEDVRAVMEDIGDGSAKLFSGYGPLACVPYQYRTRTHERARAHTKF